jgi:hypothetical protein
MGPLAARRMRAVLGAALVAGSVGGTTLATQSLAGATTTVTLYVSTSGSKTSGCTGTGTTACKTIQEGVTAAETYTGDTVTVEVAAGTYTGGVTIAASGLTSLTIDGASESTTKVTGGGSTRDFLVTSGTVTISGLSIDDGDGLGTYGGGVYSQYPSAASLIGDRFSDDTATWGGGVENTGFASLTDDTFSTDHAASGGGGVDNANHNLLAIFTDDTFSGDTAPSEGGALLNDGNATLTDDTFSTDHANRGGAVLNDYWDATLTDDTFSGDTTSGPACSGEGCHQGGGIFNTAGTVTMTDDTLADDEAPNGGGGVDSSYIGTVTITASIFDASSCLATTGSTLSGTYNVVTTTTCSSLGTKATPSTLDLTTTLKTNTSSGPETLAIGPTSSALDEVPKTSCTQATDERGDPRPGLKGQTACDAGAFELQHTPITLSQGTPKGGSVAHGTSATFQLAVTNQPATSGKLAFHTTAGTVPTGVSVSSSGKITVSGTTSSGTYTLAGTESDPLHDSGSWSFSLDVHLAPVITSAASAHFLVGKAGTFTITTTGTPDAKLTKTGKLPKGLSFKTGGNGMATISGTAHAVSSAVVTITATNGIAPAATQKLTISVGIAPKFTSAAATIFTPKVTNTFTVTTTGSPPPSITESGKLPKGVTFTTEENGTATISGTPTTPKARSYKLMLTATNGFGKAKAQKFILTVS